MTESATSTTKTVSARGDAADNALATPWFAIRLPVTKLRRLALGVAGMLTPLALWWGIAALGVVETRFLPPPVDVALRGWTWAVSENLFSDAMISMYRVFGGFLLAVLLAVPLGVLSGAYRSVAAFIEPVNDFFRYMPTPAFIPLVMIWVGIGEMSKITIIFLGTFFQMMVMISDNVRQVPMMQIEAAQTMGARPREVIRHVLLPAALPGMTDTLRVTMGWAWTYLVVAELVASSSGLGFQIMRAQRFFQTDKIFMGILIIGLLGILLDQAARLAQRRLMPWSFAR